MARFVLLATAAAVAAAAFLTSFNQSAAQDAIGDPNTLCSTIFGDGSERTFAGTGYSTKANAGIVSAALEPSKRLPGAISLTGHFLATNAPNEGSPFVLDQARSYCLDLPDARFSLLQLVAADNSEMILWLWGNDGVPQGSRQRLIGYVSIAKSGIVRSKVALWSLSLN